MKPHTCRTLPFAILAALLSTSLAATGCGDDETAPAGGDPTMTLHFAAVVGDAPFGCGESFGALGTADSSVTPIDFRFYVHDVLLLDAQGHETPLTLTPDSVWQTSEVALLDFENGCDNGTSQMNQQIVGTAPAGTYTGVRFTIGVPPELNDMALGLEQRESPLNVSGMFWSWSTGYKFLRIDSNGTFRFHLGSTGCAAPGEPFACANPNFPTIELVGDPSAMTIAFDVAELVSEVDLGQPTTQCMSEPDNTTCDSIFGALGLAHGAMPAGEQRVFRAQ